MKYLNYENEPETFFAEKVDPRSLGQEDKEVQDSIEVAPVAPVREDHGWMMH